MKRLRVIVSGGGTGGHIFPAIAIAREIEKANSNVEFLFIGAQNRMEMQKIPQAGYKIKGIWISGFQRRLTWKNILVPIKSIRKNKDSTIFTLTNSYKYTEPTHKHDVFSIY